MPRSKLLDIQFKSCPTCLCDIRAKVRRVAEQQGASEALVQKLVLVLDEAVANIIRHGYHGRTDGDIRLRVFGGEGRLEFQLRDYAAAVDASCIKPRDLGVCRPGGLGINFIDSVMDSWEFREPEDGPGNLLVMRRSLRSTADKNKKEDNASHHQRM